MKTTVSAKQSWQFYRFLLTTREGTPYASQAREILRLLRAKAPEAEVEQQITSIHDLALERGVVDPLVPSTDAYITTICFAGAKSLSHILSYIERSKERLLAIGSSSETARRQIVTSVMECWSTKPGVGINIVDKLLNYTILTPESVIEWALVDKVERGEILTNAYVYEMVATTIFKVTNRVRQVTIARSQEGLPIDQVALLDETLTKERAQMVQLFGVLEYALISVADGSMDAIAEGGNYDEENEALLRAWGRRWLRVFRRKLAIEEAWIQDSLAPMRQLQRPNDTGNIADLDQGMQD